MKTIKDYIELAIKNTGISSQNKLGKEIGVTGAQMSRIADGSSIPSEKTILNLAKLAGITKEQAVLERSYWLADQETKPVYQKILNGLKKGAAVFALVHILSATPAMAGGLAGISGTMALSPLYIITFLYGVYMMFYLLPCYLSDSKIPIFVLSGILNINCITKISLIYLNL